MSDPVIKIGGVEASESNVRRMSCMLWGPAGWGKTTLGCTLPGRKALINFDPDGPASIPRMPDLTVFNLTTMSDASTAGFRSEDAFGLRQTFDHFDSYIIDSLTGIVEKTLGRGIATIKGATIERPSPGAYQARNNLLMNLLRNLLAITEEAEKHICFISHESAPIYADEGQLIGYSPALGGQLPNSVSNKLNEVWPVFENSSNDKLIITRKSRLRWPAKSRMFITEKGKTEFEWTFNPNKWNDPNNLNMRMEDWFNKWKENNFEKIDMPRSTDKPSQLTVEAHNDRSRDKTQQSDA